MKTKNAKKKLVFPRGITKINFPIHPEFEGESIKAIRKMHEYYDLPKHSRISFTRTICYVKDFEYDLTEVTIEK